MNTFRRLIGLVWIVLAPMVIYFLVSAAIENVHSGGTGDINNPVPWIIIIGIFTPIAIGLMIFGYYCLSGEYDNLDQEVPVENVPEQI